MFLGMLNLQTFDIHSNIISNLSAGTFDPLPNLNMLDISFNGISVIDSYCFVRLNKLTVLYLHWNNLTNLYLNTFSDLSNLNNLSLSNNKLSYLEASYFTDVFKLSRLYVQGNQISYSDKNVFQNLTRLTKVYLSNNRLRGNFVLTSYFGNNVFGQFSTIYLQTNQITAFDLNISFSRFPALQFIYLYNNNMSSTKNQIAQHDNTYLIIDFTTDVII